MNAFEVIALAKKLFADRGLVVESPKRETLEQTPDQSHVFEDGSECHAVVFENGYVHFHVGKKQWAELLPIDAPEVRIRYMRFRGREIASHEWFSC